MRVHVDMIAGNCYASDVRLTAVIPETHRIGAYYMGHERIILAVPRKSPDGFVPLPTHRVTRYDDGPSHGGERMHMVPINPLEWTDRMTCPCDGTVIWKLDQRAPDPVLCIAEWGMYGWGFVYRPLASADTQPEITAREDAIRPILAAVGMVDD